MTLHKTDHLSEKDIQKRKSTFSNFELQELLLFLTLISKSKKTDDVRRVFFLWFWHITKSLKIFKPQWVDYKKNYLCLQSPEIFGAKI